MNKWLKRILVTIGILILIILGVAYFSISSVDKTPYFETDYYSKTVETITEIAENRVKANGEFQAGFAKVNITPVVVTGEENPSKGEFRAIKLAGFGDGQIATGVHNLIFTKAVAVRVNGNTAILVSSDILLMSPLVAEEVKKSIEEKTDLKREQLFFGATHTHASIGNTIPGVVGKMFGGEYQPGVVEWLAQQTTKVILSAVADIKPAKFSSGYIRT